MVAEGARRRIAASSAAETMVGTRETSSSSFRLRTVVSFRPGTVVFFRGGAHFPAPAAILGREGSFGARGGISSSSTPSLRRRADSDPARRRSARRTGPPSHASESLDGDEEEISARGGGTHRVAPRLEKAGRVRSSALASASGLSMNVEDGVRSLLDADGFEAEAKAKAEAEAEAEAKAEAEAEAEAARDRFAFEFVSVFWTAEDDSRSPAPPRTSPKDRFHHASASSAKSSAESSADVADETDDFGVGVGFGFVANAGAPRRETPSPPSRPKSRSDFSDSRRFRRGVSSGRFADVDVDSCRSRVVVVARWMIAAGVRRRVAANAVVRSDVDDDLAEAARSSTPPRTLASSSARRHSASAKASATPPGWGASPRALATARAVAARTAAGARDVAAAGRRGGGGPHRGAPTPRRGRIADTSGARGDAGWFASAHAGWFADVRDAPFSASAAGNRRARGKLPDELLDARVFGRRGCDDARVWASRRASSSAFARASGGRAAMARTSARSIKTSSSASAASVSAAASASSSEDWVSSPSKRISPYGAKWPVARRLSRRCAAMRGDASEARTSSVMSTGVSIARAEGSMRAADPPRAAQCPRRVVRGRRCCQLESAQGRRVILDHSTVGKTHRRRPRQPRTRTGALLARATSAAVAMALLARASDGTIGLTSLGAEVRASSPSLLSPASSSRTLVSLAPRPTPSSPPEPTPQMAALDARASALDHLTQLISLAASLDDGEEALFDHPPPRARRPTQATRHSTAIDPDPTAPPSSTPGFDRLARRVAEMTAVADELSRVEAAELAWLGVRDAVARTGARANDTNSAARRPEPDPAGDVRALAANLARVATCGGVPPGDGSSSACDGSTSERDVSALDAFRALETFAEISTRAEDATPPRRGTERRFDAKNPKGSRGSRGNARFDAKNAWFAETCGRWGVAHAAMGAALRDASPRIPNSGPAPAEDDPSRFPTKNATYASPWAKHATRAIDAVVSALECRERDETTPEFREIGFPQARRGRRRVDPSATLFLETPSEILETPSETSRPPPETSRPPPTPSRCPSVDSLHWLAELIERTSRAAANWIAHQPRLLPSSRTASDLCLAHSDAARVDDALARAEDAFANAANDADTNDDAAASAAASAGARVSAARARLRLAVGRVADALVGFFAAAAESAYAAAPKGSWSTAGAPSRGKGKRDAIESPKSQTWDASTASATSATSATSAVRDAVLLPIRRALATLDARVAASILPVAASAAVQALLARVSAEGRGGVRARGGGAARLRADVDALVAAADVERAAENVAAPVASAGATALSAWRSVARRAAAVVVVAETAGDASRARERAAALAGLADANAWIETCAA